ncbi:related to flavin-binding monooxygenase [Rhynchosporium graminicola]|uniref:Related to flavin-binding monooxygenase n=1 Tax=Rhynchosporium graminicola TaxID=2792576 RepID=A0A1E1KNM0_9HELO|nr:related to flavin-binding monooxygenase [Rhynchosporium commune]
MSDPNPSPTVDYGRNTNRSDVLIVGAGLSGMITAIDMIRQGNGRNFIIVEKGNQVGGTWNDQRYPGCCCDVWSHLYSLSFEPNPNWTREYPGQEEILEYLVDLAHKYKLYKHIRFNSAVEEARWDESSYTWKTKIARFGSKDSEFGQDYIITSDFFVSGVGQLNVPKYPDITGIDSFSGKLMHSARWDWDYDLRDKKIGIIGNGATAAQIIPEIAKACKNLVVFQRTPNWVIPRDDKPITPMQQAIYKYVPFVRRRYRAGLMDFRESFFEVVFDTESPVHELMMNMSRDHKEAQLPGEKNSKLRDQLQPHYAVGCKRVIISDDYFTTFAKPNVTLETTAIQEITPKGVTVEGGREHEFDLLVLATGFKTTQFMYPIKIYGSGGKSIEDLWKSGASAYLGITVPSLPNFGMLYGPNTNLGHNSIILMIEAQSLYINNMISKVKTARSRGEQLKMELQASVVEKYNSEIQSRLGDSAFADPNCNSWYKNEAGLITNNWAEAVIPYQKITSSITWDDYEVSGSAASEVKAEGTTKWSRVVEETQVSDTALLAGLLTTAGAIVAGALCRKSVRSMLGN